MHDQPHVVRFRPLGPDAHQLRVDLAQVDGQFGDAQAGARRFLQHQPLN